MTELDLTAAINAAAGALWAKTCPGEPWATADAEDTASCHDFAETTVRAALPLIERAVRWEIATELDRLAAEVGETGAVWDGNEQNAYAAAAGVARGKL